MQHNDTIMNMVYRKADDHTYLSGLKQMKGKIRCQTTLNQIATIRFLPNFSSLRQANML